MGVLGWNKSNTDFQLYSYQWKGLPITETVINRVEKTAPSEEEPEMIDGYPNLEWSPGNPITDGCKNEDDDKSEYEHIKGYQ